MKLLAIIIIALLLAGCEYRINPGARCAVLLCDSFDQQAQNGNGCFDQSDGSIRVTRRLSRSETILVAMHEFVHACEANPRLPPRDVLRLYACPAWPAMSADLERPAIPEPRIIK